MSEDITQNPAYKRGYQESMYWQCEIDKKTQEAYNRGWTQAMDDLREKYMQSNEYKERVKRGEIKETWGELKINWDD